MPNIIISLPAMTPSARFSCASDATWSPARTSLLQGSWSKYNRKRQGHRINLNRRPGGIRVSALRYAHNRANPERRTVGENVVAVYRTPFVTPWRGIEMILVVIDFIAALPVFVFDWCASP